MNNKIFFLIRFIVAIILIQTLRYKFTAHPDSVYIFSKVNLEPVGRIGIGILELIAAILIIIPRTIWAGALLSVGIISGAIFMHLTNLGIEIKDDGGTLFILAITVFILSASILYHERRALPVIGNRFKT